jgi:hypothetical protein
MRAKLFARLFLIGLISGSLLWTILPPPAAWVEEHYSRGLFRSLARVLVPAVDFFPFSVSGAGLLLLGLGLPAAAFFSWRKWRKDGTPRWKILARLAERLLWVLALGYAMFLFFWGAGYHRESLQERLSLDVSAAKPEDVLRWLAGLTRIIDRDGPSPRERREDRALESLRESLGTVVSEWDHSPAVLPHRVKRVPPGLFLTFGNAGVTSFLLEPHVDGAVTPAAYLSIAAHELSHVAGYAREADADLLAAVAGLRASDAWARYSVALRLFRDFASELPREGYQVALQALPRGARDDLDEMDKVSLKYRVSFLARAQRRMYDSYLRSQGLKEGIREYSFVVKLLIALERKGMIHADPGSK